MNTRNTNGFAGGDALAPAPRMAAPEPRRSRPPVAEPSLWAHRRILLFVFLAFLAVHLFLFRGILRALPDLLAGRSVINTSELVPFFDPNAQFFEQAGGSFSELTHGYEFRVRYSVLTTWMRYYLVLPFAIILAPLLGAYVAFLLVSSFLIGFLPTLSPRRIIHATALSTLLIHLILLPAKITHFYTLILGFDIFIVSFVLLLRFLLTEQHHPLQVIVAASLTALVNPAVHFLVLYPLTVVFLCSGIGILLLMTDRREERIIGITGEPKGEKTGARRLWKRIFLALVCTLFLTLLPYGAFVKFYVLQGVGNLSDIVPDTVQSIKASSLSLLHQLTFDLGSATNNFLTGDYIPATPRTGKLFYFLLVLLPFLFPVTRHHLSRRRMRSFLLLLFFLLLIAMWCSVGYSKVLLFPTFHGILAAIFNRLYLLHSPLADLGMRMISEVIHVLRSPDRFQFIYFAIISLLLPLGIIIAGQRCALLRSLRHPLFRLSSITVCSFLFFLPLLSHWEYRAALLSGDFGGFLRPYPVQNLREIKDTLVSLPQGRTVVLPPSETSLVVQDSEGMDYRFIDKFYIYFLNQPSFYYGLSGETTNKSTFFQLFQSFYENTQGWVNTFRNLGIRYLVINKELGLQPANNPWYLRQIMNAISYQPLRLPEYFRLLKENDSFALLEFTDPQISPAPNVLLDPDWSAFRCLQQDTSFTKTRHTLSLVDASASLLPPTIIADRSEKVLLDLYAKSHPLEFVRPDNRSFAFNPDHIPSSQYFGTVFPMFNLITGNAYNPMNMVLPGPFDTLTSTFVGLPRPTTIRFPLAVEENGTYEILLRAAPTMHQFSTQVDEGEILSTTVNADPTLTTYVASESVPFGQKKSADVSHETPETLAASIPKKILPVSHSFGYVRLGTMALLKGQHWLILTKSDSNPLVIEGILLFPVGKSSEQNLTPTQSRFISPSSLIPAS